MMPLITNCRSFSAAAGKVPLLASPSGEMSSLSSRPFLHDTTYDVSTSGKVVPGTFIKLDPLLDDNDDDVNILTMWKIHTQLTPSSCNHWKYLPLLVDEGLPRNCGQSPTCSQEEPRTASRQPVISKCPGPTNTFSTATLYPSFQHHSSLQDARFNQTGAPFNSRLNQTKTHPKTSLVNLSPASLSRPLVHHVSAKISPVNSPRRKSSREDKFGALSLSKDKHRYFSGRKSGAIVPGTCSQFVQTDVLSNCKQHQSLSASSPPPFKSRKENSASNQKPQFGIVNLQNTALHDYLCKQATVDETFCSDIFIVSQSSCLIQSITGISESSEPNYKQTENKNEVFQHFRYKQCASPVLRIPTKRQVRQTLALNLMGKAKFNKVFQKSKMMQTDNQNFEKLQFQLNQPQKNKTLPFSLVFRFANFVVNKQNQHFWLDEVAQKNIRKPNLLKQSLENRRCGISYENPERILCNTNKSRWAARSEQPCDSQRKKRYHNWNTSLPKNTLAGEAYDPKNTKLWYNANYSKRPQTFNTRGGDKWRDVKKGCYHRQMRLYRQRKALDSASDISLKTISQTMKHMWTDQQSCASSENDLKAVELEYAKERHDKKCNSETHPGRMNTSSSCHSQPASKHKGAMKNTVCLDQKHCVFESTCPINASHTSSLQKLAVVREDSGKNCITTTVKSWPASRDTLMNFVPDDKLVSGNQHHALSTAFSKLLFHKCHSLSSVRPTQQITKFDPSSLSPSSASCPLLSISGPEHLCSFATSKQTSESTPLLGADILPTVQEGIEKTDLLPAVSEETDIIASHRMIFGRQQLTENSHSVPLNDTELITCFTESPIDKNSVLMPDLHQVCSPECQPNNPLDLPKSAGEQLMMTCYIDAISPDRRSHYQSDSVVVRNPVNSNMLAPQSGQYSAIGEKSLACRLSGGSDRKTPCKLEEAEGDNLGECTPLIDMSNLDCDSSMADQTVIFTCNECCKSCASTTGWSCHTSTDGSGVCIPTSCAPSTCDGSSGNSIKWWEVFPGSTRQCTSTYEAKGKCEIPVIEEEIPSKRIPKKCYDWIDNDPFVSNKATFHEIPHSYDYSYGPNSYYQTGRRSLAAGGQPKKPVPTNGNNSSNAVQWWGLPAYQNRWNGTSAYDQEATCMWQPVPRWQGWVGASDWQMQQRMAAGPEQTWTSPQNVFQRSELPRQSQISCSNSQEVNSPKRRRLIHPSVRKPRLRPPSTSVVCDCGSQINTLPPFEDNETPVSICDSQTEAEEYFLPHCYQHSCEAGVVFDCSTQTNISKVERPAGFVKVVHYRIKEPRSSPKTETNRFCPSPVPNRNYPSPAHEVTNPSPFQNASATAPVPIVTFPSNDETAGSPPPDTNGRFSSELNQNNYSPVHNTRYPLPTQNVSCPSPVQNMRYFPPPEPHYSPMELNQPRAFSSSPNPVLYRNSHPPPSSTAQTEEEPSEEHDCPQEGKSGLVSDVNQSDQGFRNCLNYGTNQNIHHNRKGVYAVRVISNGKESQNKTNQCLQYHWLPSIPWPAAEAEAPCDFEVYYDSPTCQSSDKEPVEEKQKPMSWKKEFHQHSAPKSRSDKRAAGGGGGGRKSSPHEELLPVHSNSHKRGSSHGNIFDKLNFLKKDLKRRRGKPVDLSKLQKHKFSCRENVEHESAESSTEWTDDCNGGDGYTYYHRHNNRNEADCDLVVEHDKISECNRSNDLPRTRTKFCLSPVEEEEITESDNEPISPLTTCLVTERFHHKRPKKVQFEEPCCSATISPVDEDGTSEYCADYWYPPSLHTEHLYDSTPTEEVQLKDSCCSPVNYQLDPEDNNQYVPSTTIYTAEECGHDKMSAKLYLEELCKATQTTSPTFSKSPVIVAPAVVKPPHIATQTEAKDQADFSITDICITAPGHSGAPFNWGTCSYQPQFWPQNNPCHVKPVVCSLSGNNSTGVDHRGDCGCNSIVPNYNDAYNNYGGYPCYYPNYTQCGCYCCPQNPYHSMGCYTVPTQNFGSWPYEAQWPANDPRHTPSPAKFKESYRLDDWSPPPFEVLDPESPCCKITSCDCDASKDSQRFIHGLSCMDDAKLDCEKKQPTCNPRIMHAATSGNPLLEVLAENEEVMRAAKDCLQRTVNYISVSQGTSGDNLCSRKQNSPGCVVPDCWPTKSRMHPRCQVIDKISDESINLNDVNGREHVPCSFTSPPPNEHHVESRLLLDRSDGVQDPCGIGHNSCDVDVDYPCDVTNMDEK